MTFRFEEEDFAHTYNLEDYYCTNPFCDCNHVTLSFRDIDNEANRISFLLGLNGGHGPLPNQPKLTKTQVEIVRNFVKNMPKEMMVLFKQRYTEAKAHGEKSPASYLVFEPGRYVNYLEFFPKNKKVIEFGLNNKKYFVEDCYEMDPRQDNKDVQLVFYELDIETLDKQEALFNYKFHFTENKREEADAALSEEQGALVLGMTASNSNLLNLFKDRYKGVKKIGEDLLQQAPKNRLMEVNIHRNEMCPCGSGKKFKRCCGSKLN